VRDFHAIDRKTRTVTASDKAGLGIEVNESAIAEHPFQQELPQRVFYKDGAVGDW
jgi:galactonate dehydratase